MKPAEMANSANYAAMNYGELLNTMNAYTWAIGFHIDPLLKIKRLEEMEKITRAYVTAMNGYDATREEIIVCLEKVGMKENHMFSSPRKDGQTSSVKTDNRQNDGKSHLALPEPESTQGALDVNAIQESPEGDSSENDEVAEDDPATSSPAAPEKQASSKDVINDATTAGRESGEAITPEKEVQTVVEKAIETTKTRPVPENINVDAPYYIECTYKKGDNGNLVCRRARGRNMSSNDLVALRLATEKYIKLFKKKDIVVANDDCLVFSDQRDSVTVRLYCFPKHTEDGKLMSVANSDTSRNSLSEDDTYNIDKTHRCLNNAIKLAKEYSASLGTDLYSPCYDEYIFYDHGTSKPELKKGPMRIKEDESTLSEIMNAFETFAKLEFEKAVVLSKDNCIAALIGNDIYLLLFNYPKEKNSYIPRKKRMRKTTVKTDERNGAAGEPLPVIGDTPSQIDSDINSTPTQREKDIIVEAVNLTRKRSVSEGVDVNKPYSVQQNFIVTTSGGIFPDGKAFSSNMSAGMVDKNKTLHRKFARTMKANTLVSKDDYTAYIWDEGKKLTVFYYNTNTQPEVVV